MKDEGRSLGAALWEEAPNRRKLLRLKDAVVSVPVKRRGMIASGADWEGERKLISDEASKTPRRRTAPTPPPKGYPVELLRQNHSR